MASESRKVGNEGAPLLRRFGLVPATALNMSNMIGVGPFITIPLLMSALGGPQAMLGWIVAVLIAIPDGMVWSELGAAMPGSGGSYLYLREGYGRETFGRLIAIHSEWAVGNSLGLHRLRQIYKLHLDWHDAASDIVGGRGGRRH